MLNTKLPAGNEGKGSLNPKPTVITEDYLETTTMGFPTSTKRGSHALLPGGHDSARGAEDGEVYLPAGNPCEPEA